MTESPLVIERSCAASSLHGARPQRRPMLGMPIVVELRESSADPALLDDVFEWFRHVDATFSTTKEGSEINRIDRGELAVRDSSPEVRWVLGRCLELQLETRGYFNARATGRLDPSGLVKGWSVDRAAALLDDAGVGSFVISAGGDLVVRGGPWRIGVQHPQSREYVAAVIEATDLAIATSGTYLRGDHVVNPYTGKPPSGVLSVTVVGPDLASADAYATAAFAMGAEASADWLAQLRDYEAMVILEHDVVLSTPGFPDE